MVSQGRFNRAKYFDEVVVFAGGGDDRAYLYDSPGGDTLVARPDGASFYGPGFYYALREFEGVVATASGGNDTADFHGSTGADAFFASSVEAQMSGSGYFNRATGFGRVTRAATAASTRRCYSTRSSATRLLPRATRRR